MAPARQARKDRDLTDLNDHRDLECGAPRSFTAKVPLLVCPFGPLRPFGPFVQQDLYSPERLAC